MSARPKLAAQQMGEGPDVVLIHGLGTNRAFWYATAVALQDRYRVTLFDLRGHGYSYSERPPSGYRPLDFAEDTLGVMDWLSVKAAAVVGRNYGGGSGAVSVRGPNLEADNAAWFLPPVAAAMRRC